MIEYIANKTIDEKETAVRFIGYGKFVVLKGDQLVPLPDDYSDDPKEVFGEEFDRVSEYRTFYDTEERKFRLTEIVKGFVQPETYISIPEGSGEIDGWMIGKLDKRSQLNDQRVQEEEQDAQCKSGTGSDDRAIEEV